MPSFVPEESEGERFTRSRRSAFQRIDRFADFEMSRLEGLTRGQGREWDRVRRQFKTQLRRSRAEAADFVKRDMQEIFGVGMKHGTGDNGHIMTQADKSSVRRQRTKAKRAFEEAAKNANNSTNVPWRRARKFAHADPWQKAHPRGLAVVYKNGTRMPYGTHQSMVVRSHAQMSYNLGVIRGGELAKVEAFEILDGPGCGMTDHNDGSIANGQIVSARDAKRFILAHPNCSRTFNPLPGEEKPPARSSVASDIYQRAKKEVAALALSQIAQIEIKNIVLDLVLDQEMRKLVFSTAIRGTQSIARMQDRLDRYVFNRAVRDKDFTEQQLIDAGTDQINEYLETGDLSSIDDWLRFVLMENEVLTPARVLQRGNEFDYLAELRMRSQMTHRELNVANAIEKEYGEQIIRQLAAQFPEGDDLVSSYSAFLRRYDPISVGGGSGGSAAEFHFVKRARNRVISRVTKAFQDQTTNRLARAINARGIVIAEKAVVSGEGVILEGGRVSFPRLGRYLNRKDMFGVRYNWGNRALRYESTLVNRWRHFDKRELEAIVKAKGWSIDVVKKIDQFGANIFEDVIANSSRQQLIERLGYQAGGLQHFTINPTGLFRLGFRIDPAHGWRRPEPVLSIVSKHTPFRYRGKFNRGRTVGAKAATETELGVEGTKIRSISHEISIVTGGATNLNVIPGINLGTLAPGLNRIGIRLNTVLNQIDGDVFDLNNLDDAKFILKNRGAASVLRQTKFLSAFIEFRALGWSWFRIGHTLSLKPEQVATLARLTRLKFGGGYRTEAATQSLLIQAERLAAQGASQERSIDLIARAYKAQRQRTIDLILNGDILFDEAGNVIRGTIEHEDFALLIKEKIGRKRAETKLLHGNSLNRIELNAVVREEATFYFELMAERYGQGPFVQAIGRAEFVRTFRFAVYLKFAKERVENLDRIVEFFDKVAFPARKYTLPRFDELMDFAAGRDYIEEAWQHRADIIAAARRRAEALKQDIIVLFRDLQALMDEIVSKFVVSKSIRERFSDLEDRLHGLTKAGKREKATEQHQDFLDKQGKVTRRKGESLIDRLEREAREAQEARAIRMMDVIEDHIEEVKLLNVGDTRAPKIGREALGGKERIVQMGDLNKDPVNIIERTWLKLEKKYPTVADRISLIAGEPGKSPPFFADEQKVVAWAVRPDLRPVIAVDASGTAASGMTITRGGTLSFRITDKAYLKLKHEVKDFAGKDLSAIVAHEFAHHIHFLIEDIHRVIGNHPGLWKADPWSGTGGPGEDIVLQALSNISKKPVLTGLGQKGQGTGFMEAMFTSHNQISKYAASSWMETFAEAFAQVWSFGDEASEFAREIVRLALEELEFFESIRGSLPAADLIAILGKAT